MTPEEEEILALLKANGQCFDNPIKSFRWWHWRGFTAIQCRSTDAVRFFTPEDSAKGKGPYKAIIFGH